MLALRVYYRRRKCAELYQLQLILLEWLLSVWYSLAQLTGSVKSKCYTYITWNVCRIGKEPGWILLLALCVRSTSNLWVRIILRHVVREVVATTSGDLYMRKIHTIWSQSQDVGNLYECKTITRSLSWLASRLTAT